MLLTCYHIVDMIYSQDIQTARSTGPDNHVTIDEAIMGQARKSQVGRSNSKSYAGACSPGSPDVDELGVRASKIRVLDESLRDKKGTIGSGGV